MGYEPTTTSHSSDVPNHQGNDACVVSQYRRDRPPPQLEDFLEPFHVSSEKLRLLASRFEGTFRDVAANCDSQFLPTPISSALLGPIAELGKDEKCKDQMHLAIDIGGTNLRVGFVQLLPAEGKKDPRVELHLDRSSPIGEQLKHKNPDALFEWIGRDIADVVREGCAKWGLDPSQTLPMGVTFSFPMQQHSLAEANPMSMGKGFDLGDGADLGTQLLRGYEKHRGDLPCIRISAIANDSVSTLISFIYQYNASKDRSAAMGLIVGTGCNATVTLPLETLGRKVEKVEIAATAPGDRVAVNTEWTINGAAAPLRELGLITPYDEELDRHGEAPGFQPLEYLTSGRYLGELCRIIFVDYLTTVTGISAESLPERLRERQSMSTTFLSSFGLTSSASLDWLKRDFPWKPPSQAPANGEGEELDWTNGHVSILYWIAHYVSVRAASLLAAATVALLRLSGEIPPAVTSPADGDTSAELDGVDGVADVKPRVVGVGYTGGCIENFQDYLYDYQKLVGELLELENGRSRERPVKLEAVLCRNGGISGAGILSAALLAAQEKGDL